MLYIFNRTEKGQLNCEIISQFSFNEWIQKHIEDIKPECHPKFINFIPDEDSQTYEYCILYGKIVIPNPVMVIKEYRLPI